MSAAISGMCSVARGSTSGGVTRSRAQVRQEGGGMRRGQLVDA